MTERLSQGLRDSSRADQIDRLLGIPEAAIYLGTKERFVRRLVAERRVEFFKIGRHVRIRQSELQRFVESSRVEAQ